MEEQWDRFIESSINGNFLHKRNFYNSNILNKIDDHSVFFLKKNKIVSALPAICIDKNGYKILNSHLRSTYGGFIINEEIGVEESLEMVHLLIDYAKANSINEIIIRNPFRILYDRISDESDYALWYHDFLIKSREVEIYVNLEPSIEIIKKRYENGTKYNIKKAWKFVTVKESDDIGIFWNILTQNLEEKHGKRPVHSLEEINYLINNSGKDHFRFYAAYHNDNLVAGCLVFIINKIAIHAQYIAQDSAYQEFRPINAVLDYIIEIGNKEGFKYFNLGTANEGGKVINTGLFHFKQGFGGRGVLRETMHLKL